jgi:hypothetical protein
MSEISETGIDNLARWKEGERRYSEVGSIQKLIRVLISVYKGSIKNNLDRGIGRVLRSNCKFIICFHYAHVFHKHPTSMIPFFLEI